MKKAILLLSACIITSCAHNYKPKVIHRHRELFSHVRRHVVTHVTLTCYQPVRSQCDSNPLTTADGSHINLKHLKHGKLSWCAVSRDLLYLFPNRKRKIIYIEGYGVYEVHDVMNKRYTHHVDILKHPSDSRLVLRKGVKVVILK